MTQMADIFISYAHEDQEKAQRLASALEAMGWTVFWDRKIPPGKTWREYISTNLNAARCVVVAWSKTSVESEWVLEESDEGKQRKILVPVLFDEIQPPLGFRSIQTANLSHWKGELDNTRFDRFAQAVKAVIGVPTEKTQTDFNIAQQQKSESIVANNDRKLFANKLTILLALGALLVLSVVGWYAWLQHKSDLKESEIQVKTQNHKTTPGTGVTFSIDVTPSYADLYVDGTPLSGKTASLEPGDYALAALAPSFFGQITTLTVTETSGTTTITLAPTTLPSDDEHGRFVDLTEADEITTTDVNSIQDYALRTVLQLKRLKLSAQDDDFELLDHDLRRLSLLGDAPSTLILYLFAMDVEDKDRAASLVPMLESGVQSEYALGTFWYGIHLLAGLPSRINENNVEEYAHFLKYCRTMKRAVTQGLTEIVMAGGHLKQCPPT